MQTAQEQESARILIVEDESLVAMDIQESLEEHGYEVVGVFDSGEQAVKAAELHRPSLVLMDIKLKGEMNGITAAQQIRERLRIPVIFLTAYADEGTLQKAKLAEPYGYILKPFEALELRAAVEVALHRSSMEPHRVPPPAAKPEEEAEEEVDLSKLPNDKMSIYDFLKMVRPFNKLPERAFTTLARVSSFRDLSAGEIFAYEGDEDAHCFVVMTGRIALLKASMSGKELIVELLPPGDVYGVVNALEQQPYPVTVRAQCESRVIQIPKSSLVVILEEHPKLFREFARQATDRLTRAQDFARGLAHDRVEVRIASALLALIPSFATRESRRGERPSIEITRQELADLTGTSPETAIRCTKSMERGGTLDLTRPGVITVTKRESLEELLEE